MGFKLFEDKIGTLSHASGVVSLGPSIITIGGQQYATTGLNRTISSDVTLAANTLYMVYAVVSAGVLSLRVSTNLNSTGPSGFTAWGLVGAFYTNVSSAFDMMHSIYQPRDFSFAAKPSAGYSYTVNANIFYNTVLLNRGNCYAIGTSGAGSTYTAAEDGIYTFGAAFDLQSVGAGGLFLFINGAQWLNPGYQNDVQIVTWTGVPLKAGDVVTTKSNAGSGTSGALYDQFFGSRTNGGRLIRDL